MTTKQKIAFEEVVKGSTITSAMRKAGYAESTAQRTNKLTKTDGWQELMDKHFSDEKLAAKINEGLEATRTISAVATNKQANGATTDFIDVPDYAVRHKYVETSLKLKGRLKDKEEPPELPKMVIFNIYGNVQPDRSIQPPTKAISSPPDSLSTGV